MLSETKSASGGFDIISIGAATVDIFVKSNQFLVQDNLLSLPYSSKNEINQSLIASGGGATNSAVSFSRLGLKSGIISLLGQDPLSQYVLSDLKTENISPDLLVESSRESTDFSVILVAPDGGRSILTSRGDSCLKEDQIPWDKIRTNWFYITSLEGNVDLLEKIIGFARESKIKIALNPGNRELTQRQQLLPLLSYVDYLLLNRAEAEIITGLENTMPGFWDKISQLGSKIISVTDGRNGAYVFSGSDKYYSPVIDTSHVDETGAGDAFGSTFVAAQIHNLSHEDSLFWGIKNSASVVSHLGAKAGLLSLDQIKS